MKLPTEPAAVPFSDEPQSVQTAKVPKVEQPPHHLGRPFVAQIPEPLLAHYLHRISTPLSRDTA